jgi:outer membrane protein, multidrug efflux system
VSERAVIRLALSAVIVLGVVTACAVGPDYEQPETAVSADFLHGYEPGVEPGDVLVDWWKQFDDPELTGLIGRAFADNKDLAIATANLRASRALLRQGRYELAPIVTASGSATRQQLSPGATAGIDTGVNDYYDVGFDAGWELDIFGRVRRSVEALGADYGAQEATLRDALVSVAAEVARTYLELRGQQYRLAVAQSNAENQEQTYQLTQALLEGGRGTDLDIARAQSQLEATRATIPPLEADIASAIHRLSVLVGRPPAELYQSLITRKDLPALPELATVGHPEALLRRRPDIRVAERELAAATARQGVAVADLFPRVTLTGSFGYLATSTSDLGGARSQRYSFGPSISWAAFDLGRVQAGIDAADARAQASLANYERTVLTALEETESSVVRYSRTLERQARLQIAVYASDKAADLARLRYRNGIDSFLTVLDAERRQLEAQDALAAANTDTALALVAVYKALGGGWEAALPPP